LSNFVKVCKTSFRSLFYFIFFKALFSLERLEVKLPPRQQGLRECKIERVFPARCVTHSDSQPQLGSSSRHARNACVLSLTLRLGGSGHELDAAAAMISKFLALACGNTES
jgi:hypothetical protein